MVYSISSIASRSPAQKEKGARVISKPAMPDDYEDYDDAPATGPRGRKKLGGHCSNRSTAVSRIELLPVG